MESNPTPPFDTLTRRLRRALRETGMDDLERPYVGFRSEFPWVNTEWEMTRLGHLLAEEGNVLAAIRVLELCLEAYPEATLARARLFELRAAPGVPIAETGVLNETQVPRTPRGEGRVVES